MTGTCLIEVAYAAAQRQTVVALRVPVGTTLIEAVRASGLLRQYPEIVLDACRLGVHGRLQPGDAPVSCGDRVEIYRPLQADPKAARRARARSRPARR